MKLGRQKGKQRTANSGGCCTTENFNKMIIYEKTHNMLFVE
jgi:hypothetical protein